MNTKKLQQFGGISSILLALIYISAFIVYGAILLYPASDATAIEKLDFLTKNHLTLSIINFVSYVFFGIVLVVLVLALQDRLKHQKPQLSKLTSIFGFIWVGLVIASGMIANIGLEKVIEIGARNPENAMLVWSGVSIVTEGLGGGNEIVGGLWVLLLSITALKTKAFSKALSFLGVFVGLVGILTIYPLEIFTEIFGLTQILWFLWIGIAMIRKPFNAVSL